MTSADDSAETATRILQSLASGSPESASELYSLVRGELHELAAAAMGRQAADHTLQPTALVHEAWLRLFKNDESAYENRGHFLGVAARAMRSILVDHARRKRRDKHGGAHRHTPLQTSVELPGRCEIDLVELDDALTRLARECERRAQIVTLRFFGGLTIEEASAVLEVGHATVEREWHMARVWLRKELGG